MIWWHSPQPFPPIFVCDVLYVFPICASFTSLLCVLGVGGRCWYHRYPTASLISHLVVEPSCVNLKILSRFQHFRAPAAATSGDARGRIEKQPTQNLESYPMVFVWLFPLLWFCAGVRALLASAHMTGFDIRVLCETIPDPRSAAPLFYKSRRRPPIPIELNHPLSCEFDTSGRKWRANALAAV